MTSLGAFKLPHVVNDDAHTFAYGGAGMAFDPVNQALYLAGHDAPPDDRVKIGKVTVPAVRPIPVPTQAAWDALPTAPLLQPLTDPFELQPRPALNPVTTHSSDSIKIGGVWVDGERLIVTAYVYYDGNGEQRLSHWVRSPDLSKPSATGPFQVGSLGAGYVSGYFGRIPDRWQSVLGGSVLNGQCALSVISRTSDGPCVFAINPADIGIKQPVPAQPLLYYPPAHPLPSNAPDGTPWNNRTVMMGGVVFPEGSRSVLFFGRIGLGEYWYGDIDVARDPAETSKGGHAYPYSYYCWAYDAVDLALVKQGKLQPWEPRPYACWKVPLPFQLQNQRIAGVAYDPATGRIFLSQPWGDWNGSYPLINVFEVKRAA